MLTGCFGGELRLWNLHDSNQLNSWRGHSDRICSIAWSPLNQLHLNEGKLVGQSRQVAFASSSLDSTLLLGILDRNCKVMGLRE